MAVSLQPVEISWMSQPVRFRAANVSGGFFPYRQRSRSLGGSELVGQNSGRERKSLIRAEISLIADLNSLQGRKKFPVRMRRELEFHRFGARARVNSRKNKHHINTLREIRYSLCRKRNVQHVQVPRDFQHLFVSHFRAQK